MMELADNAVSDTTHFQKPKRFVALFLTLMLLACSSGLMGGRETPSGQNPLVPTDESAAANTSEPTPIPPTPLPLESPPTATPTATATSTPTPEPTPDLNLADEQVLVLPGESPSALDPHLSNDTNSLEYVVEIFSGLMAFDPELNLVPDLAERYEVSGDGLVYTFYLRPQAKFQDGKPVRAQDFKWSFERACDPATGSNTAATYLGDIVGCRDKLQGVTNEVAGVQVLDDFTLQLTIDEPKGFFLAKMAYPTTYVLDRENVESGGPLWSKYPNGSGPYRLEGYEPGQQVIVLTKNPNYYRDPLPILEEVRYLINAPFEVLAGYREGVGQGATYGAIKLPISQVDEVVDPDHPLAGQVVTVNALNVDYIGFNVNQPPFNDVKIRQAFNLALDKRAIVKDAFEGNASVANGIVPLNMPDYQNPDLSDYEFDLEHARDLIAESSYGSVGNLPPIILHVGNSGAIEQAIADSYRNNLGLDIMIVEVPWLDYLANLSSPDTPYQMYRLGWLADYPDPQDFLEVLFHSKSAQNYGGYNNAQVDALLDQARGTPHHTERLAIYREAEQLILDNAAWVPLYFEVETWLIKPYVKNFRLPPIKAPKLQYAYIEAH